MKVFTYTVKDPEGVHALPASGFIKLANGFTCSVTAQGNGSSADCKHLFGLMGLGVKCGQDLTITCDGADEIQAAEALERFLKNNL
jgi:phosphotransferase system HPr (HPr) family protein